MSINWDTVEKSFDKYFSKLGKEGCCIKINKEYVVVAEDEIRTSDGEGNYYE